MAGKSRALLADLGGATKKDILELAESHRVRYLRLMFTDILGINKNVEIPASQFAKALDGDIMFDGSSIEGFVRIEESDMLLVPDLSTFKIFPGGDEQGRVARLICDIQTPEGAPFDGDPRGALKRQVARAAAMGYTMNAGMEAEFFMFKLGSDGAPTTVVQSLATYYHRVRRGLGFTKSPQVYGAFPTDPYSHTPARSGAQQPGMTGQVKEEVLTRFGELGVVIEDGRVAFRPRLLPVSEFLTTASRFEFRDHAGAWTALELTPGSLAFTLAQVPVVYRVTTGESWIAVTDASGQVDRREGDGLDETASRALLARRGGIARIEVGVPGGLLAR